MMSSSSDRSTSRTSVRLREEASAMADAIFNPALNPMMSSSSDRSTFGTSVPTSGVSTTQVVDYPMQCIVPDLTQIFRPDNFILFLDLMGMSDFNFKDFRKVLSALSVIMNLVGYVPPDVSDVDTMRRLCIAKVDTYPVKAKAMFLLQRLQAINLCETQVGLLSSALIWIEDETLKTKVQELIQSLPDEVAQLDFENENDLDLVFLPISEDTSHPTLSGEYIRTSLRINMDYPTSDATINRQAIHQVTSYIRHLHWKAYPTRKERMLSSEVYHSIGRTRDVIECWHRYGLQYGVWDRLTLTDDHEDDVMAQADEALAFDPYGLLDYGDDEAMEAHRQYGWMLQRNEDENDIENDDVEYDDVEYDDVEDDDVEDEEPVDFSEMGGLAGYDTEDAP
jgi:hypothetical protein